MEVLQYALLPFTNIQLMFYIAAGAPGILSKIAALEPP